MKVQSTTTYGRRWLLLACYMTVLLPGAPAEILCINHCGASSIEAPAHSCHGAEHEHEHHEVSLEPHVATFSSAPAHSDNCCIDIPLETQTPQLVNHSLKLLPVLAGVSGCAPVAEPAPLRRAIHRRAYPPPERCVIDTTVLLL